MRPQWGAEPTAWQDACEWVARSGQIPPDARFITPRLAQTFKWYAGRGEVVNWKEIPQDAAAIVKWKRRIDGLYVAGRDRPHDESLADLGAKRLQDLGERYKAAYVITVTQPRLDLPVLYKNSTYIIYQLRRAEPPVETTDH